MKELIGKLSRGVIEYCSPSVETSVTEIKREIKDGQTLGGAFSVFCENESELKGIIYSTSERVIPANRSFVGRDTIVKYTVDTSDCENEDVISGCFNIVTNGGEVTVPYSFEVKRGLENTQVGEIKDLFQFTNLVKTDYDQAVPVFTDSRFSECLLKDNLEYQALYEGLIKGRNVNNALEEFLIGINKKQRVVFKIDEDLRKYDSLSGDYGDIIRITKDTWGYVEINVETDGAFISECKSFLTTDDFAGNTYEYGFTIKKDRLHGGVNYGKIIFDTGFQRLEFRISVDNSGDRDACYTERKICASKLTKMYLKFRMRRCSVNEWSDESIKIIDRLRGFDDSSNFIKLVQAQIYLSQSMDEQAGWLLGNVAEDILDEREKNVELYAYYLYIRTLQKRNPDMTSEVLQKVKHYYENGYDSWRLLWILLYLDNSYESNKSLKIARIKEQYNNGCRSPLMYFEALNAFSRQPALLRVINDFELQVLVFGCRYEGINIRLAIQISELAAASKKFRPLLFKVMTTLYERFENKDILNAICSMLIRGNKTGKKYYKWYRLGVMADIRLAKLYEYYIFSMESLEDAVFNEKILMYFVTNSRNLMDKQEMLYASIIKNRDSQPDVYKKYSDNIEKFALEQIQKGMVNKRLEIIYRCVLRESMIDNEMAEKLVDIMHTYRLRCFNDNMDEVVVIHKEIGGKEVYKLKNGVAYIRMYTEDPAIVFIDNKGKEYSKTINYTMEQMYTNPEYTELAVKMRIPNEYLMAEAAEKILKYKSNSLKNADIFRNIMKNEKFRTSFKKIIMQDVMEFYYENYDGDELDEYLLNIDDRYLNKNTRLRVTELMLLRGIDSKAEYYIKMCGIDELNPRRLLKYVVRNIRNNDFKEDEDILDICIHVFKKGKYNEIILKYLCMYYNGTTKEMLDIWKACRDFEIADREFEERLLAQMLFTRTQLSSISDVYDSYYENGASEEMKNAYLFYEAYTYIVLEKPISDSVFKHLGVELEKENTLNNMCMAAYVKYYSENRPDKNALELCETLIKQLVTDDVMFDFYKKYNKKIKLPPEVMENAVIEYRTPPDKKVYIHYITANKSETAGEYTTEEMEQVFQGIYTKKLLLFYGENIMYYITEENEEDTKLTESRNYYLEGNLADGDGSRYSRLNEILICSELNEDSTLRELMENYYCENKLIDRLF